ncbi:MAG: hypothetical protein M3O50_14690 [Myxococcota bacterium]|nr:hypothetical protein [Myxococcota bacterium]
MTLNACTQPPGYVSKSGDCCDSDPIANPGYLAANAASPWQISPNRCGTFTWNCESNNIPVKQYDVPPCSSLWNQCANMSGGFAVDCGSTGCSAVCNAGSCTDFGLTAADCGTAVLESDYSCSQSGATCTASSNQHIANVQGCY